MRQNNREIRKIQSNPELQVHHCMGVSHVMTVTRVQEARQYAKQSMQYDRVATKKESRAEKRTQAQEQSWIGK